MVERLLRTVAIVLSLIVAIAFVLFARDQMSSASHQTRAELAANGGSAATAAGAKATRHSGVRKWIDNTNHTLLSPFASIAAGGTWTRHAIPALFGLLVYGFLLGYLARFTRGHA